MANSQTKDTNAIAYWNFDKVHDNSVLESVNGSGDTVSGYHRLVDGVKGQAIVMDGYTSCISRHSTNVPELGKAFTIEAWVAIGAYPWNWAPIIAQENTESLKSNMDEISWPEDITNSLPKEGFFFGISPQGQLGLHIGSGKWQVCRSVSKVPLREWTHVAATYDKKAGVILYINGEKTAEMVVKGKFKPAKNEDLRIGMPRQKIEASNPVRAFATLPSWYSFDGLLDEISIYDESLSSGVIEQKYSSSKTDVAPDLPPRVMPSGPAGQGKFGASYTHLEYFPEWDAQWRVSSDPDIVVQFDDSPVRVVFWRGTRYGPAWVMENGIWMGDQSIENFNGKDGCMEHMLDPRCRFSHVRIIENTPARVVIHWRYLPTAANGNHSQVNPISGWEDWVDEYYTFYPDQLGFRKVVLHSDGEALWPEEVIGLCQPGQRPEDIIELDAMTLANLKGEEHTYSWAENSPKFRNKGRRELGGYIHFGDELGEKPNIMMVNMKSEYKPFQIFELECNLTCFAHEHRKDVSHFPWWNHWPVAMIPSDGRYCQAADRPSHFSLAWASPRPHKGENNTYVWTWMYGATQNEIGSLTSLARSWSRPPKLQINSGASDGQCDSTQRCYVISNSEDKEINKLEFSLLANEGSPLVNPAFVIKNWGDHDVWLKINGKEISQSDSFRVGHIRSINQNDLVVWLELESDSKIDITMDQNRFRDMTEPQIVTPGNSGEPPTDAIILFDKDTLINFVSVETGGAPEWVVSGEEFTVKPGTRDIRTKQKFGNCQLHIEWKTPEKDVLEGKTGQQCSNSGIYLMGKYEIQVLNSFNNKTYPDGQAAAFYGNFPPLVNASREPGQWQVYDIIFIAPEFDEKEEMIKPGYFTVFHNGILVQNHVPVIAPTTSHSGEYELSESELPLMLQDHSNEVSYRNIWIRKL